MSDHTHENPGGQGDTPQQPQAALPVASLLRAAADDELTPDQQARLETHLASNPGDADRVAFERSLRTACGRAMATGPCPDALRQRIARIAAEAADSHNAETQVGSEPGQDALAGAIAGRAEQTRNRGFWSGENRRVLQALAAAVAVLVGGAFIWQAVRLSTPTLTENDARTRLASFVAKEHSTCMTDPSREAKFTIDRVEDAPASLAAILGSEPTMPELADLGFRFVDAGGCRVPGVGKSAHLRFETDGSGSYPSGLGISLFVQQARDSDLALESDQTYVFEPTDEFDKTASRVYAWRVGDLKYYLVAEQLELCDRFRDACGMPEPTTGG